MKVELSDREIAVLECVFDGWDKGEQHGLYGNLSYKDAIDLAAKLGLPKLTKLEEWLVWDEKRVAEHRKNQPPSRE